MAWRLARSLETLRNQVNAAAPNRSKVSDGTIGDASHQAETTGSDHNPNATGVVCAFDITHDPARGMDVGALAESLIASRDGRIKYLIFNRRALEPGRFGWTWQPYTGSNSHATHLHVSVKGDYDNTTAWRISNKTIGDEMIPDKNHLDALFRAFRGRNANSEEVNKYVGKESYSRMVEALDSGPERENVVTRLVVGTTAVNDNWEQQIYSLQDAVKKLQNSGNVSQAEIDALAKQADALEQSIKQLNK